MFCLVLIGESTNEVPDEDVCLSVRRYDGRVSRLDMQLYVSAHKGAINDQDLLENLKSELVVALAQWDGGLANDLRDRSFEELLDHSLLKQVASERGWGQSAGTCNGASWEQGSAHRIGGRVILHSSICALVDTKELSRRLWQAQLRVLYPFVEEQRRIILDWTRPYIRMPYTTRFGATIQDANDLEIGHIETILKDNMDFRDRELMRRIEHLREIRNNLAHFEVVRAELLRSSALADPLGNDDAQ